MSSASDRPSGAPRTLRRATLRRATLVAAGAVLLGGAGLGAMRLRSAYAAAPAAFRVCADPNNMPFSDSLQRGFENRIASLVAADLRLPLQYDWRPQRRGFIRNGLKQGTCDVVIGVPSGYDMVMPTEPYYQSTYVFVTRTDRRLPLRSFDDPLLAHLRVGVHMMGDDYANSPAAVALMRRRLGRNIVPYMIYGDYSQESPPSRLLDGVVKGDVDVAVAWGPLAGYYARHSSTPLTVTPVSPAIDTPFMPYVFDISMGVRHGDSTRRALLDTVLHRRQDDIRAILADYGVPSRGR